MEILESDIFEGKYETGVSNAMPDIHKSAFRNRCSFICDSGSPSAQLRESLPKRKVGVDA